MNLSNEAFTQGLHKACRHLGMTFCAMLVFLFVSVSCPTFVIAQATNPKLPSDKNWNVGHELFQILLQQSGFQSSTDIQDAFSNPEGSAIVIIGKTDFIKPEIKLIQAYVQRGGRVLLAANAMHIPEIASIDPGPASAERRQDEFEGFSDCILLSHLSTTSSVTEGLNALVTNITGWIPSYASEYQWQELANLPSRTLPLDARGKPVCMLATPRSPSKPVDNESSVAGGIIVLADPSIISNGMLWYEDNGHFTARITNWLSQGYRSNLIFISNGTAIEDYPIDAILPPEERQKEQENQAEQENKNDAPKPEIDTLLALANQAIREMSNPKDINAMLQQQPRYAPPLEYAKFVLGLLLGIGLLFFAYRLMRKSTIYLSRSPTQIAETAHQMSSQGIPEYVRNKVAAEIIAKEFSTRWTGSTSESDWRRTLDELKHVPTSKLPAKDRVQAESLLAIAIFGGRGSMTNNDLIDVGKWGRILITRYPNLFVKEPISMPPKIST